MRIQKLVGSVAIGLGLVSTSVAGDVVAGKAKADAVCAACHGADGNKVLDPSYPRLAGQHKDYLAVTLLAYQRGGRKNAIMAAQAKQLSKADIENVAAYYASLPGQLDYRKK